MEKPIPRFSMEELKKSLELEDPDPDAMTIPEWAEYLGIGRELFRKIVKNRIEEGTWAKCVALRGNKRYPGYKPLTMEVSNE